MPSSDFQELISSDSLYTIREFQKRMGMGRAAWRSCVRKGIPVKKVGRRKYLVGEDVIDWFRSLDTYEDSMQTAV